MKFWKTACYAVWTVLGIVSLAMTVVGAWFYRGLFKSMK